MSYDKHKEMVLEFHRAMGLPENLPEQQYYNERFDLRRKLYKEEAAEMLDALVDMAYISIGTDIESPADVRVGRGMYNLILETAAVWFGIPAFNEAFKRVHAANMAKLKDGKPIINGENGVYDETKPLGKVLKPEGWEAPNLEDLV